MDSTNSNSNEVNEQDVPENVAPLVDVEPAQALLAIPPEVIEEMDWDGDDEDSEDVDDEEEDEPMFIDNHSEFPEDDGYESDVGGFLIHYAHLVYAPNEFRRINNFDVGRSLYWYNAMNRNIDPGYESSSES